MAIPEGKTGFFSWQRDIYKFPHRRSGRGKMTFNL
jgi:hypothetical protein